MAKEGTVKLYRFISDKIVNPVKENIIVMYDQTTNYLTLLIKIYKENQSKLMNHLKEHYENVQVFIKDNWMRLDFQKYSHLSTEDLKKSISDLYEFMRNYEYFQKVMEIKSNIYKEAIHYMKKDLQTDNDNRESTID